MIRFGWGLVAGLFVCLWSTGFIAAKLGLPYIEPLTLLALRFLLVIPFLVIVILVMRVPWPQDWTLIRHSAVAGLLVQAVYLGCVFAAINRGLEAGTAALIVSLQPIFTASLARHFLKEPVTKRQWFGLGLGTLGVVLVVWDKLAIGLGTPIAIGLCITALIGISFGTVYQKRFCQELDLRVNMLIQATVTVLVLIPSALLLEEGTIHWHKDLIIALLWLVLVLSLTTITLFYILLQRGAASTVVSLFCLVPPVTALLGWLFFGEVLRMVAMIGFALTVTAVALVTIRTPDHQTA